MEMSKTENTYSMYFIHINNEDLTRKVLYKIVGTGPIAQQKNIMPEKSPQSY